MESQWTNNYAILRDLSFAQGRKVPAKIIGSVGAGEKPPVIRIKEDTEEEFFQCFVGDGDSGTQPDLNLIKEMLKMVKESDPAEDEGTENLLVISKLNPLSNKFAPKNSVDGAENDETSIEDPNVQVFSKVKVPKETNHFKKELEPQKKRRERNAAIMSLLEKEQMLNGDNSPKDDNVTTASIEIIDVKPDAPSIEIIDVKPDAGNDAPSVEVKLLRPNDFMLDVNITEAVEKVNEWLQKPADPPQTKKKIINLSPMNMFKKKNSPVLNLESTSMFKRKSDSSSIKSFDSDTVQRQPDKVFVPSSHANEYYKKFVERHQVQEMAKEDIWKRAERLMKEIDIKRIKEREKALSEGLENAVEEINSSENDLTSDQDITPPINIPGLSTASLRQSVLLSQHRHDLSEECAVCLALAKHKQRKESAQKSQCKRSNDN